MGRVEGLLSSPMALRSLRWVDYGQVEVPPRHFPALTSILAKRWVFPVKQNGLVA